MGDLLTDYPKAKVFVNDSEVTFKDGEVPAIVIDGSTVLPIRKVAEKLQAIVQWDKDTMTANIYKPNVHMFVSEEVKIDKNKQVSVIKSPFSVVETGKTVEFAVVVQVDGLKADATGFKISIIKPDGDEYDSKEVSADTQHQDCCHRFLDILAYHLISNSHKRELIL